LRLQIKRAGKPVAAGIPVKVKILGSTFAPQNSQTLTGEDGSATMTLALPAFQTGRAAVLIQAEEGGDTAELRRIIVPGNN
jgi:hypothetical protein